jgi:hypothetical protein
MKIRMNLFDLKALTWKERGIVLNKLVEDDKKRRKQK